MRDERNSRKSMPARFGRHARSNIAGYIAIALALSVTPAIANHLTVKTSDLENNAVTTPKIKNNAVKASKISNLPGRRVVDNPGQPKFSDGGQGDCIWQDASSLVAGLGKPNFYVDHLGIVHMGGIAVSADGLGGDGDCGNEPKDSIVFKLPKNLRPSYAEIQGVGTSPVLIVGKKKLVTTTDTFPAGSVIAGDGIAGTVALDGITFRTASAGGSGATSTTSSATVKDAAAEKALLELLGL